MSELGEASEKRWGKFNLMQIKVEFRQQRPIGLFGVVSESSKIEGLWRCSVVNLLKKKLGGPCKGLLLFLVC